jgi:hypothetical protein
VSEKIPETTPIFKLNCLEMFTEGCEDIGTIIERGGDDIKRLKRKRTPLRLMRERGCVREIICFLSPPFYNDKCSGC